jgi:hypothetical protein
MSSGSSVHAGVRCTGSKLCLGLAIELYLKGPDLSGVRRLIATHPILSLFKSIPEVRDLPSTDVTRLQQYYVPVRLPPQPPTSVGVRGATLAATGLPRYPDRLPNVPCPLPRWTERVLVSILPRCAWPSPKFRRVGVHDFTFEACSGFTRVTARPVAQPPKAAFVTRLRQGQLPSNAARQLPDRSTPIWVDSASTGDPRLRGARNVAGNVCGSRQPAEPRQTEITALL